MIGKIKQSLEELDWTSPKEIVSFYDSNLLYFNHVKMDSDLTESEELLDVKLSYCHALLDLGHFSKCYQFIKVLNIDLNGIENKETEVYREKYERYLFMEGVALARLKQYEESLISFKELVNLDPEKDLYREWVISVKTSLLQKQLSIIGYLGFGIIMLDLILGIGFNIDTGRYTYLFGFVLMGIGFFLPYGIKWFQSVNGNTGS